MQIFRRNSYYGEAVNLTRNSGPALNFQPRISPDGKRSPVRDADFPPEFTEPAVRSSQAELVRLPGKA